MTAHETPEQGDRARRNQEKMNDKYGHQSTQGRTRTANSTNPVVLVFAQRDRRAVALDALEEPAARQLLVRAASPLINQQRTGNRS